MKYRRPASKSVKTGWLIALLTLVSLLMVAGIGVWLSVPSPTYDSEVSPLPTPTLPVGYAPQLSSAATILTATAKVTEPNLTVTSRPTVTVNGQLLPSVKPATDRYGLIVTGLGGQPETGQAAIIRRMLDVGGADWWYSYEMQHPKLPGSLARQVFVVRLWGKNSVAQNLKYWLDFVARTGHFRSTRPTGYLATSRTCRVRTTRRPRCTPRLFTSFSKAVRAADPQATIIGPNVLNWDQTCRACPGFQAGQVWTEAMRTVYHDRYGTEPPLDVWSLHTYSLDWSRLPMIDQSQDASQIENLRTYLDRVPALRSRPIWLSEFGVVWGYEGIDWQPSPNGGWTARPQGKFRADLIEQYISTSLDWLEANADRLHLDRWFIFTSLGEPESFSPGTFAGVALFDAPSPLTNPTNFGRLYFNRLKKAARLQG